LRGACATIGATQLQRSLAAFELALDRSTDAAQLAGQARALHQALLALATRLRGELEA
jgi:hypothetical protein